jgi:hypothetical protein
MSKKYNCSYATILLGQLTSWLQPSGKAVNNKCSLFSRTYLYLFDERNGNDKFTYILISD